MIKTTDMMLEELRSYANPSAKLSRMVKNGECFQIIKGLYETNRDTPGYLLAGSIYGPSYISFDYALSYYGFIPESVYVITCASFEKKKKKKYETIFGTFTYRDIPAEAFPFGVKLVQEGDYFFRIAEPEKAVCDKLYTLSPVANIKDLARVLTENLRIEESCLKNLDADKIQFLSEKYHSTNIKKTASLIRRIKA
jgi:predicted transcriptional regulator of viral defense system